MELYRFKHPDVARAAELFRQKAQAHAPATFYYDRAIDASILLDVSYRSSMALDCFLSGAGMVFGLSAVRKSGITSRIHRWVDATDMAEELSGQEGADMAQIDVHPADITGMNEFLQLHHACWVFTRLTSDSSHLLAVHRTSLGFLIWDTLCAADLGGDTFTRYLLHHTPTTHHVIRSAQYYHRVPPEVEYISLYGFNFSESS